MARAPRSVLAGAEPLSPRRKWRAILIATVVLVPCFWGILAGVVSMASERQDAPAAGPFIAFGLALVPFVFIVLAFSSEHPRAPGAVLRAMGLSLLVGILVSALAADVVTGLVAATGAGGIVALRADANDTWKGRAIAVLAISLYVAVMIRVIGDAVLLFAPTLPFTSIGVADHLSELRRERRARSA